MDGVADGADLLQTVGGDDDVTLCTEGPQWVCWVKHWWTRHVVVVPEKRAKGQDTAIREPCGSGLDVQKVASLARELGSARSRPQQHLRPGLVCASGAEQTLQI